MLSSSSAVIVSLPVFFAVKLNFEMAIIAMPTNHLNELLDNLLFSTELCKYVEGLQSTSLMHM